MTVIIDPLEVAKAPSGPEPSAGKSLGSRIVHGNAIYRLAFLVVLFAAWWATAQWWLDRVMPFPGETLARLGELVTDGLFYEELSITTYRVIGGFAMAFLFGIVIGSLMGLSRKVEAFFELAILTGVAAPGLFVAMIVLVAFGINDRAAMFGIAIISAPSITVSFWQATKNLDRQLGEMSQVFQFSRYQRIRHLILPQLLPPGLAATRYGLGFAWKLVVVLELLGLSNGIGFQVNFAFQLFDLRSVIAWTLGFMVFVLLVEYLLIRPLEFRLTHWRDHGIKKEKKWKRQS
jgi:NitT/TauT family transport system permease protein